MHIAANSSEPWYRQRWPWLLMVMPGVSLILGVMMVYLAITTNDGLVVDDYYNEGKAVGLVMTRSRHAADLGLSAGVHVTAERVSIDLGANSGVALPRELVVRIIHPTQSGFDQTVRMSEEGGGHYSGELAPLRLGHWQIQIEDVERTWRLRGDMWLPDESRVTIEP